MPFVSRPLVFKPALAPGLLAGPAHRHPPPISLPHPGYLPRPFHSTSSRADEAIDNSRNHYETLKIHPSASPGEIKKAFYTLSKTHHPDLHRSSPSSSPPSSQRFMRISEAYSVLSTPSRRAAYDRDVLRLHAPPSSAPSHKGSYSSTHHANPAGGRPASGLSRRRTTFRGPPPSFYRSGGWGAHAGKRGAAHGESTGFSSGSGSGGGGSSGKVGGMGPGQDPFGHRDEVPHFDREAHERTGRRVEQRRAGSGSGGAAQRQEVDRDGGMFFVVGGIVLLSFFGPWAVSRLWSGSESGGTVTTATTKNNSSGSKNSSSGSSGGGEAKAARESKRRRKRKAEDAEGG
ncbi:hypothetical protein F4810DRAFT_652589 [Camillea tinctor]|nr:hypothetical protein F4810DRAFT_652589 [Camillea tinctor]